MSTPEGLLTAACIRYMQRLKDSGTPIHWLKIHGHAAQRRGEPDLDIVHSGQSIKIELKRKGRIATPLQLKRLSDWARAGAIVAQADSIEAFQKILEDFSHGRYFTEDHKGRVGR